ncbi:MAG: VOC family protein [Pseudomonadota bacterium]
MTDIAINWFEIPVQDEARATEFYGTVLETEIGEMPGPDGPIKVFQAQGNPVGALDASGQTSPAQGGVRVYFSSNDIDNTLSKAESAGGKIVMPKTSIGPHGFIGQFADPEGNIVALHTPPTS